MGNVGLDNQRQVSGSLYKKNPFNSFKGECYEENLTDLVCCHHGHVV